VARWTKHGDSQDLTRYEGFQGTSERGGFVFASLEERDRYQRAKHGAVRNGFRLPGEDTHGEPTDRPTVVYREPQWESSAEMNAFLRAVQSCPLAEYGSLDLFAYLAEVGKVATGLPGGVPSMPRTRLTRRQMDERVRALWAQAKL